MSEHEHLSTVDSGAVRVGDVVRFLPSCKARAVTVRVGDIMAMPGQMRIWGFRVTASDRPARGRGYVLPSLVELLERP